MLIVYHRFFPNNKWKMTKKEFYRNWIKYACIDYTDIPKTEKVNSKSTQWELAEFYMTYVSNDYKVEVK